MMMLERTRHAVRENRTRGRGHISRVVGVGKTRESPGGIYITIFSVNDSGNGRRARYDSKMVLGEGGVSPACELDSYT